jgi:hypothetical protein
VERRGAEGGRGRAGGRQQQAQGGDRAGNDRGRLFARVSYIRWRRMRRGAAVAPGTGIWRYICSLRHGFPLPSQTAGAFPPHWEALGLGPQFLSAVCRLGVVSVSGTAQDTTSSYHTMPCHPGRQVGCGGSGRLGVARGSAPQGSSVRRSASTYGMESVLDVEERDGMCRMFGTFR